MRSESCTSHIYANQLAGTGRDAPGGGPASDLHPLYRGDGGRPAPPVLDGPLTLTHVTSEKSRRPVP